MGQTILEPFLFNLVEPLRNWEWKGLKCHEVLIFFKKSTNNYILTTLSIHNLIVIPQKFRNPLLLFRDGDALFKEVFQIMVVDFDDKMAENEVRYSTLNDMTDCKHFLFIGVFSQISTWEGLACGIQGSPLHQYNSNSKPRVITLNDKYIREIWHGLY